MLAGLGGLPWRTEALGEALLHLDSWSGWFHRSNGREVVRTLIAEASPTELNHMVSSATFPKSKHLGAMLFSGRNAALREQANAGKTAVVCLVTCCVSA